MPTSTSTRTPITEPAATAAAERSSRFAALSTATVTRPPRAASASALIRDGPTTSLATRMSSTPASIMTIASHAVAVETPMAPASTWRRAIWGALCVFVCGRRLFPARSMWPAITAMFWRAMSRSSRSAGVSSSLRLRPIAAR